jgi:hypothetical protein
VAAPSTVKPAFVQWGTVLQSQMTLVACQVGLRKQLQHFGDLFDRNNDVAILRLLGYGIPDAGKSACGQTVYSTGVHILREFPVKLLQDRPIHGCNFHFICQNTPLFYTILR